MSINSKFTINDVLLNQESLQKKNKYTCPICFEFIYKKSIYQCKSGHHACQECWEKSLKNKKQCMICRSEVNSFNDLSRCLVIEQCFTKKECYCIYSFKNGDFIDFSNQEKILIKDEENGCKEIISLDQLDRHIENCKFKFVKCSHDGCNEVLRLNSLEEHENQCGFKLVKCEYCAFDDIIQKELKSHHDECSEFPISCPQGCSIIVERYQIKSHIDNDCNNSTIQCKYYEYGCRVEMKRSELQNHLESVNHQYFMGLLIEKLSSTLIQSHITQDELYKKIEQSEKNQEKLICDKIQKQNNELSSLITKTNDTYFKKNNFTGSLDKNKNVLKYKNKWIISNYSNTLGTYPNGRKLKSPPFQINSNNSVESQSQLELNSNEFQISICPNGKESSPNYMSIFLNGNRIEGTSVKFICKLVNVSDKTKSKELKTKKDLQNISTTDKGWSTFMESKLITQKNGWLSKDDKLTIKFKVKITKNVIKPLES
ncbi:hypothetical protein ACTFIW_008995 [Dictyostelium discoideum]